MKYLLFIVALISVLPAAFALYLDRRLLRLAMFALIFPLFNFDGTSICFLNRDGYRGTVYGFEISLCYLMALIVIIAIALAKGVQWHWPTIGSILFILYFLFTIPSLRNSLDKELSLFEIWKMLMMFLVYLAVYCYLSYSKNDFDIIIYGVAVFVFVCFLIVLKQHYVDHMHQARAVFPHQNSMAMFMVLANIFMLSRFLNYKEYPKSLIFLFVFCCGAVSNLRTYSRGTFIAITVSVIVTIFISTFVQFRTSKMPRLISIFILGLAGFLIFIPKIIQRLNEGGGNSNETRKQFVTVAMNIVRDRPFFGCGVNNWSMTITSDEKYLWDHKKNERLSLIRSGIVETIYLLVMAECGIPCLLVLLCWFFYYFFISLKLAYKLRNSKYFYIPAASAGGLLGVYVQSLFEWVLKQQMNFILLVMVFAMLSYLNRNYKKLLALEAEENQNAEEEADSDAIKPKESSQEIATAPTSP